VGRTPSSQEAQRNGQSAISQENPSRKLNQAGDAESAKPPFAGPATPELSDEEVSVLCDIESSSVIGSNKRRFIPGLIERGLLDVVSQGSREQFKLTSKAQQLLGERGVGLNES
jgi:hypothetical protein